MIYATPLYVDVIFIITTLITVSIFFYAAGRSTITLLVLFAWVALQAIIGFNGFYEITNTLPPRFILMVLPPLLAIAVLFITKKGRKYIDGLNEKLLTYLHTVRIAVEMVLFWLFKTKLVPEMITFEGRNFDIFSGITAPLIAYFGYDRKKLSKTILIAWNFICLGLVLNVVIHAALSVPSILQQLNFDQPNVAILTFPFVWLPSCIVPIVIFSHLVCIRQLIKK
jgi:hypothetical protein